MTFNPRTAAQRLTKPQISLIRDNLTAEPTLLGCIESVAKRMTTSNTKRPALVRSHGKGRYTLTEAGLAVQGEL
jgi:hypothetical protein